MDNLIWGLQTSALGMGLVFGLLALLWGLLTLVLRLDRVAAVPGPVDEVNEDAVAEPAPVGPPMAQGMDAQRVAAILVATLAHRAACRREAAPAMRSYWPGSLLHASRWVGAGRARQNQPWHRRSR